MRYTDDIKTRFTARHNACIKFTDSVNNWLILDVGCWIGWYEKYMIDKDCKFIVGIDVDLKSLLIAKKSINSNRSDFVYASAYKLPFRLRSFNLISIFDVLEHLPLGLEYNVLYEANTVLNKEGVLVTSVPNDNLVMKLLDPAYFIINHKHYTVNAISKFIERSGFSVSKVEYGGGISEALSIILLYIFKHLFNIEIPFKLTLEYLREKEYRGKGYATLFIKARKNC